MNGMQGLLNVLGGGSAMGMQDLLTPEQQRAIQQQSMMAMAARLLQAGGPSTTPTSLGQALGGAFEAGQGAMQQGQMNAVQQMLLGQKIQEARDTRERNKRIDELFGGGAAVEPINLPTEQAGRVGPTAQRGGMTAQSPVSPVMANLTDTQRTLIQLAPPAQKLELLSQFEKDRVAQAEVTGQPFEVTDAQGRPVMVQQTKGGKITTLEGFGPKRDVVLQNLGGRTVAIDRNQLRGGESFAQTMTPGEAANLSVRLQETETMETPEGVVRIPKFGGGAAQPVLGPTGQPLRGTSTAKPTEGQLTASGFATRMEAAEQIFSSIPAGDVPRVGMSTAGGMSSGVLNFLRSPQGQQAKQAADDWIRAKLRKESGAVIGEEEMEAEYRTYFPMPGDSDAVVRQKAEARRIASEAMKRSAGPAYQPMQAAPRTGATGATTAAPRTGQLVYDPQRRVFVYQQ